MLSTTSIILILASLSGITTIAGVALAYLIKKSTSGISIGIGFSTGMMVLISIFELIPESVKASGIIKAGLAFLLGAGILAGVNYLLPHYHIVKEKNTKKRSAIRMAYLVTIGLILHDFPEGFAMANSYVFDAGLGILVAVAIALHNIPEEFAMAVPIIGVKKPGFIFKAALLSALAEPMGAIIGLGAVALIPTLNPLFMAFAAGAMVFVAFHELLPMAEKYGKVITFAIGMWCSVMVYVLMMVLMP